MLICSVDLLNADKNPEQKIQGGDANEAQKLGEEAAKERMCDALLDLSKPKDGENYPYDEIELLVRFSFNPRAAVQCLKRLPLKEGEDMGWHLRSLKFDIDPKDDMTRQQGRKVLLHKATLLGYQDHIKEVMEEIGWKEDDTSKW